MFKIEGTTIYLTRGDICTIGISIDNNDRTPYVFQNGDIIRLCIYEKKNFNKLLLQKDVIVTEEDLTEIDLNLTQSDTKIGEITNKPVEYWYQITLNPDTNPQTIIGYDENGSKSFILYPEGVEGDD